MEPKKILTFLYEIGTIRSIPRSGWQLLNINVVDRESVAEHSLRAAQIAYLLAKMEGYENPHEAATAAIFHDTHEARIGDLHKVARRYVESDQTLAAREQFEQAGDASDKIFSLWSQVEEKSTVLGVIVKDADWLENAITAREFMEKGYPDAEDWIDNVLAAIKTESAKKIGAQIKNSNPNEWWHGLKKIKELEK